MSVFRFILLTTKDFRWILIGMFACIGGVAIILNIQNYLIKILVDVLAGKLSYTLTHMAFALIATQAGIMLAWLFYDLLLVPIQALRVHITSMMTSHILKYDINFFHHMPGGSISSKIKDASSLTSQMLHLIIDNYFFMFIFITTTFVLMFQVNWMFSLSLLGWSCFSMLYFSYSARHLQKLGRKVAAADATVFGKLVDVLTNILSVKLFSTSRLEKHNQNNALDDYLHLKKKNMSHFTWMWFVFAFSFLVYMSGCLYMLVTLFEANEITPGDLAFVLVMHYKIIDQLFNLGNSLRDFITNWGTIQEAIKILDLPLRVQDAPNALVLPKPQGQIQFHNVEFAYPGVASLFNKKNIAIHPGQKVGLVGFSGGGKSTFVNLILRLYDVSSGRITIDGHDIAEVTQDSLHEHIAMIPQDPTLFHRSIRENILYGRPEATDEDVIEAAKKAFAHDFITKLPEGYESFVGERGVKLSGGQRQRIAIARAFLKKAPILMLDEATSQLDSLTETHIQEALWELMQNKTTLVIAHRLSTLLRMDRILVFDHGHIIEDGTHADLLALGGHYHSLWQAQVGGFLPDRQD